MAWTWDAECNVGPEGGDRELGESSSPHPSMSALSVSQLHNQAGSPWQTPLPTTLDVASAIEPLPVLAHGSLPPSLLLTRLLAVPLNVGHPAWPAHPK